MNEINPTLMRQLKIKISNRLSELNITGKDVAKYLNISTASFSRFLNGTLMLNDYLLIKKLSAVMNCEPDKLYEDISMAYGKVEISGELEKNVQDELRKYLRTEDRCVRLLDEIGRAHV